jgi:hypothetical protein
VLAQDLSWFTGFWRYVFVCTLAASFLPFLFRQAVQSYTMQFSQTNQIFWKQY